MTTTSTTPEQIAQETAESMVDTGNPDAVANLRAALLDGDLTRLPFLDDLVLAALKAIHGVDGDRVDVAEQLAAKLARTKADRLAQETAEYIARELNRLGDGYAGNVFYADERRPPTDVEAIKADLLGGHLWLSWMTDRVFDAMRAIHGADFDEHSAIVRELVESGEAVGFNIRQQGAESQ